MNWLSVHLALCAICLLPTCLGDAWADGAMDALTHIERLIHSREKTPELPAADLIFSCVWRERSKGAELCWTFCSWYLRNVVGFFFVVFFVETTSSDIRSSLQSHNKSHNLHACSPASSDQGGKNKQWSGHWSVLIGALRSVFSLSTKAKILEEMPRETFLCSGKYKLLIVPDRDSGISEGRSSSLFDQSRLASLLMCTYMVCQSLTFSRENRRFIDDTYWIKIWYHIRYISGVWIKEKYFKYVLCSYLFIMYMISFVCLHCYMCIQVVRQHNQSELTNNKAVFPPFHKPY